MKTYPEINALNLSEVREAIALGEGSLDAIKPEYRQEVAERLVALKDRRRRLEWTERNIVRKGVK